MILVFSKLYLCAVLIEAVYVVFTVCESVRSDIQKNSSIGKVLSVEQDGIDMQNLVLLPSSTVKTTTYKLSPPSQSTQKVPPIPFILTTTNPPAINWPLNSILFGGLTATPLGEYLAYQIKKTNNIPKYSVQHYWYTGVDSIEKYRTITNSYLKSCPKDTSFCLPDTIPMCLSTDQIYCVVPQDQTQLCTNVRMGVCLNSSLHLPCENSSAPECLYYGSRWRYESMSIPCISHIKVRFIGNPSQHERKLVDQDTDQICSCNTANMSNSKVRLTCVSMMVDNTRTILCSGMDLSKSTDAKHISCLPIQPTSNETLSDIYTSQTRLLLSECKPANNNNSTMIEMMCEHIGNSSNANISTATDPGTMTMSCKINLTQTQHSNSPIKSSKCYCNSTASAVNTTTFVNNTTLSFNIHQTETSITRNFCVYVAASPAKLYTNEEYMVLIKKNRKEKMQASSSINTIWSAILGRILS